MFDDLHEKMPLALTRTKAFPKGKVFMCYEAKA